MIGQSSGEKEKRGIRDSMTLLLKSFTVKGSRTMKVPKGVVG